MAVVDVDVCVVYFELPVQDFFFFRLDFGLWVEHFKSGCCRERDSDEIRGLDHALALWKISPCGALVPLAYAPTLRESGVCASCPDPSQCDEDAQEKEKVQANQRPRVATRGLDASLYL